MFANHHGLSGERLDSRLAETRRRINASQEGGTNPWEPGQSQVSPVHASPSCGGTKNPHKHSKAVLWLQSKALHTTVLRLSAAPCAPLENFGVWFPVTLPEDQVPTPDSSKAAPLKLPSCN